MSFLNSFHQVLGKKNESKHNNYNTTELKEKDELNEVLDKLTDREKEVFRLLVQGYTNSQIANGLYLSVGTVKNYVSTIYDKTGIRDRTVLVLNYSRYYHNCD